MEYIFAHNNLFDVMNYSTSSQCIYEYPFEETYESLWVTNFTEMNDSIKVADLEIVIPSNLIDCDGVWSKKYEVSLVGSIVGSLVSEFLLILMLFNPTLILL